MQTNSQGEVHVFFKDPDGNPITDYYCKPESIPHPDPDSSGFVFTHDVDSQVYNVLEREDFDTHAEITVVRKPGQERR